MNKILSTFVILLLLISCQNKPEIRHIEVYYEAGRFGGWPANNGIWSWGDEILVGFARGYHKDLGEERHNIDRDKPEESLFARSLDGGETWVIEDPSADGVLVARGSGLHGIEPEYPNKKEPTSIKNPINFKHPDLALTFRMLDHNTGPSLFYYSYNRGHLWEGPFKLIVGNKENIMARTDYIIYDKNTCMAFLTYSKNNNKEGRASSSITRDGGMIWEPYSLIGDEPKGFGIMPSTVKISDTDIITTIRRSEDEHRWIDAFYSTDKGKNWKILNPPINDLGEGNPPSLIKLNDGRLCLTYGYRAEKYGIYAKISSDNGKTWGKQITLRDDGAGRDIGYVRSIQRRDGKVVALYYFQDKLKPERYIAATIWDPKDFF